MDKAKFDLTASPQVLDVLSANPGLNFSAVDLKNIQAGDLKVAGTIIPPIFPRSKAGCITALRYQKNGTDLTYIKVGGTSFNSSDINNLNDFRERLQEAANYGHEVSFCYSPVTKKMNMLNVYPCGCKCKCENCQD